GRPTSPMAAKPTPKNRAKTTICRMALVAIASSTEAGTMSTRKAARSGVLAVDRKSTRLNSSHVKTSYAVFCLRKKILHGLLRPQGHRTLCLRSLDRRCDHRHPLKGPRHYDRSLFCQ